MMTLRDRVLAALQDVIDPCSRTAGVPLSILDMGMLISVVADIDGEVSITMRATSAMCTMIAGITKDVEQRVIAVEGVRVVSVELHGGSIWTEADMTDKGRSALEARRQRARAEIAVKPHEWKTRRRASETLPLEAKGS